MRLSILLARAAIGSSFVAAGSGLAQDAAKVRIVTVGATNVQVTENGRYLGVTGAAPLTLAPGVRRLRVGDTEHCIYLEVGSFAEMTIVPGASTSLKNTRKCDEIWSEVILESVPAEVVVQSSAGEVARLGQRVVIRVPLPDSVRISTSGAGLASQTTTVFVAAMERSTYGLRVAPSQPALLPDTANEVVPSELPPPARKALAARPRDPAKELTETRARLNLMRSRQPAARTSSLLSLPVLVSGVTAILVGAAWAADSLHERPQLGKTFAVSLGITGGLVAAWWPANKTATSRARRAGCGTARSAWSKCESMLKSDVERLGAELQSLPVRRNEWASDSLSQERAFQRELVEYPSRKVTRDSLTRATQARNEMRAANRRENDKRTRDWQAQVRGPSAVLRSRGARN